jgi:hypothetical protein
MDYADELLMEVQAPVNRPAPVARPSGAPQQRQPRSYADDLLETAPAQPQPQTPAQTPSQPQQQAVQPEPDAPSWIGRRMQDIRGKQDPRYRALPTIAEVTIKEGINQPMSESASWLAGTSDKGMVPTYKSMLGNRFVGEETDANGYPIVVYRGQDGSTQRAYVNKPGLDMQDVVRGGMGIAPYVGVGRAISVVKALQKAPLLGRMAAQGAGQAATSVTQDVANTAMGGDAFNLSDTGIKAGMAGAFGAGGEAAGAGAGYLYRRFWAEPKLFNRTSGELTEAGAKAAQDAGLDPMQLSRDLRQEFAKEMAATGNAEMVANKVINREFAIPRTKGELSQQPGQLLTEQQIRANNYGQGPGERLRAQDEQQRQAIKDALFGEIQTPTGTRAGIAQKIAPDRAPVDYGKQQLGQSIRQSTEDAYTAAKAKENFEWSFVPDEIRAQNEALPLLKDRLNKELGSFPLPKQGSSVEMAQDIQAFLKGEAPEKAAEWMAQVPEGNVKIFRERLSQYVMDAQPGRDKAAAIRMYDAFNGWIRDAAEKGLLEGASPFEAAKMVSARGISRQIHQLFEGEKNTPGARILADVLKKSDSAEGIIDNLFTGPTSNLKDGTVSALRNLKQAYNTHLSPEAAEAAWNDLGLAYFLRLAQDTTKNGEPLGAQALQSNISRAMTKQASVMQELYSPEVIGMMRRFAIAIAGIEKKNLNRSWTGPSAAGFARDMFNSLIKAIGFTSTTANTIGGMAGLRVAKQAYGHALATDAMTGSLPALPAPSFAGYGGALGSRSQD